jgi:hypothetical protein
MPLCYWWPMRTELALQVVCCVTLTRRDEKTLAVRTPSARKTASKKTAPEGAA